MSIRFPFSSSPFHYTLSLCSLNVHVNLHHYESLFYCKILNHHATTTTNYHSKFQFISLSPNPPHVLFQTIIGFTLIRNTHQYHLQKCYKAPAF